MLQQPYHEHSDASSLPGALQIVRPDRNRRNNDHPLNCHPHARRLPCRRWQLQRLRRAHGRLPPVPQRQLPAQRRVRRTIALHCRGPLPGRKGVERVGLRRRRWLVRGTRLQTGPDRLCCFAGRIWWGGRCAKLAARKPFRLTANASID